MSKDSKEPIVLSGRVFVTSSTIELAPSRELPKRKSAWQTGDLKVWSHFTKPDTAIGVGIFRAAVYNGKKWCTFRLNKVAGEHSRYESYDDRKRKLGPCINDLLRLKGLTVSWIENSYGIYRFDPEPVSAAKVGSEPSVAKSDSRTSRKVRGGDNRQMSLFD